MQIRKILQLGSIDERKLLDCILRLHGAYRAHGSKDLEFGRNRVHDFLLAEMNEVHKVVGIAYRDYSKD
jgi:hypothetical protein